jgi:hypothetical protein
MYNEYPKWLYHADGRSVIVNSREEAEALGDGWAETPAAFPRRPAEVHKPKGGKKT